MSSHKGWRAASSIITTNDLCPYDVINVKARHIQVDLALNFLTELETVQGEEGGWTVVYPQRASYDGMRNTHS
jgi:hypothetical protein